MRLYHNDRSHTIAKIFRSAFWEFELSVWLHMLASSFISIFIPILLYTAGYSIGSIIIYYVLYNLFDSPLNFIVRRIIQKIGARSVMIAANIFIMLFYTILLFLEPDNWPLLMLLAFTGALYDTTYWIPLRYLFMKVRNKNEDSGKTTGIFYIVRQISGMFGPVIGAAILIFADKQALILVTIAVFALSVLPLLKVQELGKIPDETISFRDFFKKIKEKKNYISTSLLSMHAAAEDIIWPLFIFITIGTIESVAGISLVISLTTLVFTGVISLISNKSANKLILIGSALIAITWIVRLSFSNSIFYYVSVAAMGFFAIMVSLPIDADIFKHGEKEDPLSASTYENFAHMFSGFIFFLIVALAVNVFKMSFITATSVMFTLIVITFAFQRYQKSTQLLPR